MNNTHTRLELESRYVKLAFLTVESSWLKKEEENWSDCAYHNSDMYADVGGRSALTSTTS